MFAGLAAVSMTVGNVVAIAQSNVKRLLGYSTIAQAGYMLIGVAAVADRSREVADSALGIESVLFYLGGYAAISRAGVSEEAGAALAGLGDIGTHEVVSRDGSTTFIDMGGTKRIATGLPLIGDRDAMAVLEVTP